jgi:hypothetical protein
MHFDRLKRRDFITLLGGTAAWPLAAWAQERLRKIGVLTTLGESDPEVKSWFAGFQEGLQKSGWVQGRNISNRISLGWRRRAAAADLRSRVGENGT